MRSPGIFLEEVSRLNQSNQEKEAILGGAMRTKRREDQAMEASAPVTYFHLGWCCAGIYELLPSGRDKQLTTIPTDALSCTRVRAWEENQGIITEALT